MIVIVAVLDSSTYILNHFFQCEYRFLLLLQLVLSKPLHFLSRLPLHLELMAGMTCLVRTFSAGTANANMVTCKIDTCYCKDASDKELLICTILEFVVPLTYMQ